MVFTSIIRIAVTLVKSKISTSETDELKTYRLQAKYTTDIRKTHLQGTMRFKLNAIYMQLCYHISFLTVWISFMCTMYALQGESVCKTWYANSALFLEFSGPLYNHGCRLYSSLKMGDSHLYCYTKDNLRITTTHLSEHLCSWESQQSDLFWLIIYCSFCSWSIIPSVHGKANDCCLCFE